MVMQLGDYAIMQLCGFKESGFEIAKQTNYAVMQVGEF